ncbi:MAG: translational GTPase TypA [Crocinitomicaceae bacterium]|jgi:GTP-binding protein|nr:translational GTPase TypA [Crocinitomicaceae bacterium]MDP4683263.1 translational GTPase TypA [Crocinitomicaceae bacterium]MDP4866757.1 translational GTPase TypA [Crocinitomicaceae bacterium]MDP5011561.1 translational GTPase TypA [Crocinitomicaceae bacterium]MDP5099021.1 translational GTPase TypA [Crocinitomicaceae bacterium]
MEIRNIAIIAHVDHGKTTLVDKMIEAGAVLNERDRPTGELIMDSNDLERERGITIVSKNVSVYYKGTKINIIDTPGHADFGGEVERVLNMADGVCLLVDAFEGPMPQTRFVLGKALALGLKPLLVINKVDKDNCTPDEVHEKVFDLMFELDANEQQLDFATIYGSAKNGWMSTDWKQPTDTIAPLLDEILTYFPPKKIEEGNTQMLITSLDFSTYVGRIAIGCLRRGTIKENQQIILQKRDGTQEKHRIKEVFVFSGLAREKVESVQAGDICAITGIEGFEIGDCVCDFEDPQPLDTIQLDEPTMNMLFSINDSPFFGKEGKKVTSRHIQDRLTKELEKNLAMRVADTDKADKWIVSGRGVLHLSVLIETMRREGYELQVGQPQVIIREIDGKKCEPIEELTIDLPEEFSGTAVEAVTKRKGEMTNMEPKGTRMVIQFLIPSRGIIGLRNYLLTQTAGEAIMTHRFLEYQPYKGDIPGRQNGSMISLEQGVSIPFSLNNLQDRGKFFINPNENIYEGQVIGENSRAGDLCVNVTKTKKMSNMRSSGADEKVRLAPAKIFSLEECLEYIQGDEYVEVTPENLRIRKVLLKESERKRSGK